MARGDSARRVGLVRYPQGLSDCSGNISKVGNTPAGGFSIPKMGDVFACGAKFRRAMAKRMARGDSARRVGTVRYPQGLSDCSGAISNGGTTLLWVRELRKLGTFLIVEPEPGVVWQNGCDHEI
jgi:hypothetical protein